MIEHFGGDMQPVSDIVQAHGRPLALLLGDLQRGIEDRGPQARAEVLGPGGVLTALRRDRSTLPDYPAHPHGAFSATGHPVR